MYTHQEYPKWVTVGELPAVLCSSESAEFELIASTSVDESFPNLVDGFAEGKAPDAPDAKPAATRGRPAKAK